MPVSTKGNVILNAGAVAGELVGTYFLTFLALGVYVIPGITGTVIGVGLAFGFAALVMTYLFLIRSGSHFNTGVTLARALAWVPGLHERDYWGAGRLWWDFVFWVLYTGAQLTAAVLAVLTLRYVDKSGLLAAATITTPNGNLAGDNARAFFLLWLCNTVLCWAALVIFSPRLGLQLKFITAPIAMGFTYFAVVLISVFWGTGSVCNFAIDMALGTLVAGNSSSRLWISAIAQIVGALTGFLFYWAGAWVDRILDVRKALTGNKHLDHSRINALSTIMNFMAVGAKELAMADMGDTATDRVLVAENASGENYPGYSHDDRRPVPCTTFTLAP